MLSYNIKIKVGKYVKSMCVYLIMSKKLKLKNKYEKYNDVTMTRRIRWLNRSVVTINVTLQLLDILVVDPRVARNNYFMVVLLLLYFFYNLN